jgi:uncharacterized protein YjiS (DUF1127 family)
MTMLKDNLLINLAINAFSSIASWRDNVAARAELANMSDLELKDIGITRNDIDAVADGKYVDTRGGFRHVSLGFVRSGWKCSNHSVAR